MQPPIHFLDIYPGRSCLRDFLRATSPENFLQLLADAPVGFLGLGLTGCQASERCFLSPAGLKDWRLIAVTLAPHAPAAPLTGPLGENRDKPLLNPQNTFTRDYQIPWTRLLSVWGKAVGPRLCGQNRFNMVSPESTWKALQVFVQEVFSASPYFETFQNHHRMPTATAAFCSDYPGVHRYKNRQRSKCFTN